MFQVYKITNLINNKCYIGSSSNYQNRWKQHKQTSCNPNNIAYNYPLYAAFRKYGIENFSFEVLKEDFETRIEAEEFEKEMIIYYNSYKNGYNQTLETHSALFDEQIRQKNLDNMSQPCALVDINQNIIEIYPSYQEASRQQGYENNASAIRQNCKGITSSVNGKIFRDLDKNNQVIKKSITPFHNKKSIVCININNPEEKIYFNSISEASLAIPAERSSIQKCIKGDSRYSIIKNYLIREVDAEGNIIENSILIEDKIKEYNIKNPIINGERHSITEWCKIYNISTNAFYKRINKGMSSIEALTLPKRR